MLFNSYQFIFLFLPLTLLVFHVIGARGHRRAAVAWLVATSLLFYGWWNPAYLGLILLSIAFNYGLGLLLGGSGGESRSKPLLIFGVGVNLGLLGYFKYANFFVDNLNALADTGIVLAQIVLPLAISFFTFQQIAYLVDAYRGETREYSFLHYCLFVTFFPQLIAGPIVHHKEMLPQFAREAVYRIRARHVAVGLTIFAIGLVKKVILADGVAVYATPVFQAAESGSALGFLEAWQGALAYSLQLYFDFAGYSDMAIGLARLFGVRLPLNFNSPYKATSIAEFWRRWHITLSRFLRDYLYIPLGGNRNGEFRRLTNLMITMLLGGLWHGAGWTFVLWGGLHGSYLVINHGWSRLFPGFGKSRTGAALSWGVTMLAVIVAWVPFRALTLQGAGNMLAGMFGGHGISLPKRLAETAGESATRLAEWGIVFEGAGLLQFAAMLWIPLLTLVATLMPNTQQIMILTQPAFETYKGEISDLRFAWMKWRPEPRWALFTSVALTIGILGLTQISEFLYFQF